MAQVGDVLNCAECQLQMPTLGSLPPGHVLSCDNSTVLASSSMHCGWAASPRERERERACSCFMFHKKQFVPHQCCTLVSPPVQVKACQILAGQKCRRTPSRKRWIQEGAVGFTVNELKLQSELAYMNSTCSSGQCFDLALLRNCRIQTTSLCPRLNKEESSCRD